MAKDKQSVVLVYTGDGKGKTSAAIGQVVRALGAGQRVAFVQFIKTWPVSEHQFFQQIAPIYDDKFVFKRGGKGFYHAGDHSAKGVSDDQHRAAARATYEFACQAAQSGKYDLVVADEISNAVVDGLLTLDNLKQLITERAATTSLCLTGRGFPTELEKFTDISTDMKKRKHHYDEGYLAKSGIDF
jgi:cob(I)alamin adenosyltransferase